MSKKYKIYECSKCNKIDPCYAITKITDENSIFLEDRSIEGCLVFYWEPCNKAPWEEIKDFKKIQKIIDTFK